jgi:KDO2-lipid IV(A) lauroyltransferase
VKRLKNSLIYWLVAGLVGLMRRLPTRLLLAAGAPLGRLAWLLGRRERERALSNLAAARPELTVGERRALVRGMFTGLGRSATECLALPRLLRGSSQHVRFVPGAREALEAALAPGRGVVFVTAHLGNWELMAAAVARIAPVSVLFKPSYDVRFTRMVDRFRRASGVRGIDVTAAHHIQQAMACLRQGEVLGVLVDQVVPRGPVASFLGRAARTTRLPAVLGERSGARVVFGYVLRDTSCQHAIFVEEVQAEKGSSGRDGLTVELVSKLEQVIWRKPEQWLWSLDRWRDTLPAGPLVNESVS